MRRGLLALLLWAVADTGVAGGLCTDTPGAEHRFSVHRVVDGDTLLLRGGERLRLIGIDTPELARDGRSAAVGAHMARARLERLVPPGTSLRARIGRTSRDRYGRLLAYPFLVDGTDLSALLLFEGLAVTLPYPPNLAFAECYERLAAAARSGQRGLWAHPAYQLHRAVELSSEVRGYRWFHGRVKSLRDSRRGLWINLEQGPALYVPSEYLEYFGELLSQRQTLPGQRIEVSGRISGKRRSLLLLRHPLQLHRLPPPTPDSRRAR